MSDFFEEALNESEQFGCFEFSEIESLDPFGSLFPYLLEEYELKRQVFGRETIESCLNEPFIYEKESRLPVSSFSKSTYHPETKRDFYNPDPEHVAELKRIGREIRDSLMAAKGYDSLVPKV